jgi:hypothetical protein
MPYDIEKIHYFQETLLKIAGQAFNAAAYQLENNLTHHGRGLIRFQKLLPTLGNDIYGFIEWQLLIFEQSPWTRFRVNLLRNQGTEARALTPYEHRSEHSLSYIMWEVFQARVLPDADYWWGFRDGNELPYLIAEAGKLVFGYGIPWLEMRNDY